MIFCMLQITNDYTLSSDISSNVYIKCYIYIYIYINYIKCLYIDAQQ